MKTVSASAITVSTLVIALAVAGCSNPGSPTSPSAIGGASSGDTTAAAAGGRFRSRAAFRTLDPSAIALGNDLGNQYQAIVQASHRAHNAGDTPEVKELAFNIREYYTTKIAILGETGGSQLATFTPGAAEQATIASLEGLSGSALDRAYLQAVFTMLNSHLALLAQRAGSGGDLSAIVTESISDANRFLALVRDAASMAGYGLT